MAALAWAAGWGLAGFAGWASLQPPAAVPADAPPEVFSSGRAMAHVRALAGAPRDVGSDGHRAARAHLTEALVGLGWEVETSTGPVFRRRWGARVTNISARLPGASSAPALLVVSHYDSVPTGPGAGDAAAAVGAMLEVARLLAADPPEHPVMLLLTDAEELGLLGARRFIAEGGAAQVSAVVNLEARGGGGPAMLFESHAANSTFIDVFARSSAPVGTSLAYEVYRRMPNDTDFSVLRAAGLPGLNFAFLDRFHHYHAALDTPERLDERSVQHHGENLWALATGLGGVPAEGHNSIYFPLPGRLLARYPTAWALPLAILAALAAALAAARGGLKSGAVLRGAGWSLLAVGAATATGLGLGLGVLWGLPELAEIRLPLPHRPALWALGLSLLAAAPAAWIAHVGAGRSALRGGAVAVWVALALALAAAVPGASYLLTWPALVAALGLARPAARRGGLGALIGWLLVAPLLGQLFVSLGLIAAAGGGLLLGLLAVLSAPTIPAALRRHVAPALLAAGGLALAVAWAQAGTDADHPRHEGQVYWRRGDEAAMFVARADDSGDAAVALPLVWGPVTALDAPPDLAADADVQIQAVSADGETRRVRVVVQTAAARSVLRLAPEAPGRVLGWVVDGVPVDDRETVQYFADLREGVTVEARIHGEAPLPVTVQTARFGLPDPLAPTDPTRMPTPWGMGTTDATVVEQRVAL